jgi:hypothetical protein
MEEILLVGFCIWYSFKSIRWVVYHMRIRGYSLVNDSYLADESRSHHLHSHDVRNDFNFSGSDSQSGNEAKHMHDQ